MCSCTPISDDDITRPAGPEPVCVTHRYCEIDTFGHGPGGVLESAVDIVTDVLCYEDAVGVGLVGRIIIGDSDETCWRVRSAPLQLECVAFFDLGDVEAECDAEWNECEQRESGETTVHFAEKVSVCWV